MFTKGHVRFLAAVVAVLCGVIPWAALAFENSAIPGPAGTRFTGGTIPSALVLTGDNAGGVGTLRIRPSDEDTQIVVCEASNNSSPEMCSSFNHVNATATSFMQMTTNGYMDSASAWTRFNTSAGTTGIYTQASTTNASNVIGQLLYSTNNTISGSALFGVTGAGTSTYTIGQNGTVTTDIRGPILNGGSATCNGGFAGSICTHDELTQYGANAAVNLQMTATTGLVYAGWVNSSGTIVGSNGYGGSTYSDADLADRVFVTGVSKILMLGRSDNVAAGSVHTLWLDNYSASGVTLMDLLGDGTVRPLLYGSQSNCSDGAGAAACSAAPVGGVVIDAAATTVVVSTTAVTANSRIMLQEDTSLALTGSPTCNTDAGRTYRVTARTAGTSFTITASAAPVTNPACLSYSIIN